MQPARDERWVDTWRELGQLAWAILLIDLIAVGLGALAARPMGAFAHKVGFGIAVFVTVCFSILIGGNLLIAWGVWLWRRRRGVRRSAGLIALLVCAGASGAVTQQPARQRLPIIDMHVHAFGWDHMGNPPPPNMVTGAVPTARTDREYMDAVLAELKRHNVVRAVAGGPRQHVSRWQAADPDRIIGGTIVAPDFPLLDTGALREDVRAGRVGVLGELALAYWGIAPNDPRMEPYWALAEELDIPVALHTGLAPPGTPYRCCPKFRTSLGNPNLLEEVLVRHPRLRVSLMHAGYPFLQETIAILHMYPQVYADLGAISWTRPREAFHDYLRALVREGFGKRLMFGSDQMMWPEAIGMAIEGIESARFLSEEQKRDIFFNNAVRFLRLDGGSLLRKPSQ